VTLLATPDEGLTFQGWTDDCAGIAPCVLSTAAQQTDKTVGARFGILTGYQPLAWDQANWDESTWQ
jgi:Divergent InlB B-repeat domain